MNPIVWFLVCPGTRCDAVSDGRSQREMFRRLRNRPVSACLCTLAIHAPYRRRARLLCAASPTVPWVVLTDEPDDFADLPIREEKCSILYTVSHEQKAQEAENDCSFWSCALSGLCPGTYLVRRREVACNLRIWPFSSAISFCCSFIALSIVQRIGSLLTIR